MKNHAIPKPTARIAHDPHKICGGKNIVKSTPAPNAGNAIDNTWLILQYLFIYITFSFLQSRSVILYDILCKNVTSFSSETVEEA